MNTESRRIAFISDHASPLALLGGVDTGGQNVYVAQVARHLAAEGEKVDIFTRKEEAGIDEIVDWQPGVRVIHIQAGPETILAKEEMLPYMDQFEQNMLAFIRRERVGYKLIHAHFFMSALVAIGIKKRLNIPFVVTFHALGHVRRLHQGDMDRFPAERLQIESMAVAEADHIIAECPQDREDLVKHYNADINRISIVPCGFSANEFYPVDRQLARKLLGLPKHKHILLQLGRMVPRKGIDNVIRALAELNALGTRSVILLIVGGESETLRTADCPEYRRLSELAIELNIHTDVIFTGRRSRAKLKFYYAAADIFITTPWYEPFGITPLEAMACGTPVIGSDVGGIKYSVADGTTGILVPPENPQALANAISELVQCPNRLKEFSENSIKRVNQHFTWKRVTEVIGSVYNNTLESFQKTSNNKNKAA